MIGGLLDVSMSRCDVIRSKDYRQWGEKLNENNKRANRRRARAASERLKSFEKVSGPSPSLGHCSPRSLKRRWQNWELSCDPPTWKLAYRLALRNLKIKLARGSKSCHQVEEAEQILVRHDA
ncbi:hypothetical protein V9T40_004580 [Parthenolecanium corni]|uniref:Uncharacterized protein n=1 Tax=Parthenolecanium corni TaxID=536013 RepID=A0AAN9YAV7_9HEMI